MKKILQITLSTVVLLAIAAVVKAQPGAPDDPDALPIDGGLSLLVAAGVGYGAKKVKENRKKKAAEQSTEK
jgi:hypothetical protein